VAFEADALQGSASGAAVTNATTQRGFRLGALAGAGLWWNVARALALRAQAEVGATLVSTRFTVNGCGTDCDFAPAPLVGRLTLGAELRFP
jgi:hypothetical protein